MNKQINKRELAKLAFGLFLVIGGLCFFYSIPVIFEANEVAAYWRKLDFYADHHHMDCTQVSEIPVSECEALVALYNATNGAGWFNQTGWLVTNTPCTWHGVTCANGQVTELNLQGNRLSGAIPLEIGGLIYLTDLYLGGNSLAFLPPTIGNLSNLVVLDLAYNSPPATPTATPPPWTPTPTPTLTPPAGMSTPTTAVELSGGMEAAPTQIGQPISSESLSPIDQMLATPLPRELDLDGDHFGQLSHRPHEVEGDFRQVTGYLGYNVAILLPPEIGNLSNLQTLNLAGNQLTAVPPEIGNLSSLTSLNLGGNQLTAVPPEIGNLTDLEWLSLYNNQLTAVPPEIGSLTNLMFLYLNNNPLSGSLPEFLTSLTQLHNFTFYNTDWCVPDSGPVTDWLNSIPNVQGTGIICGLQQFTSCEEVIGVPQTECEALVALYNGTNGAEWHVQTNWLVTNTPCSWYGTSCEGGHITKLILTNNRLSGTLPEEIGNLVHLTELLLFGNGLTTSVPPRYWQPC